MAGDTIAVTNPQVVINNVAIPVVPNSVRFTEGKGEQTQRVQSAGGGQVTPVYSDNVETHISKIMMSMINTPSNIELVREWKSNKNANAMSITGDEFQRSFSYVALTNDYEVALGSDGVLELEFAAAPAV